MDMRVADDGNGAEIWSPRLRQRNQCSFCARYRDSRLSNGEESHAAMVRDHGRKWASLDATEPSFDQSP